MADAASCKLLERFWEVWYRAGLVPCGLRCGQRPVAAAAGGRRESPVGFWSSRMMGWDGMGWDGMLGMVSPESSGLRFYLLWSVWPHVFLLLLVGVRSCGRAQSDITTGTRHTHLLWSLVSFLPSLSLTHTHSGACACSNIPVSPITPNFYALSYLTPGGARSQATTSKRGPFGSSNVGLSVRGSGRGMQPLERRRMPSTRARKVAAVGACRLPLLCLGSVSVVGVV
ncbi:hypothetical protein BU24DRAFT_84344 [Aaosphaeria arxii CBS 175.79]|uniref:Uncharacterized protein n=1 Tax=Aaosphaeria arxii CBS 175.79 TaxID=1450172 RepID=A0A6A5X8Q4_9PLEO|nr:uncharacterized protein BU24DRAFT_84344 [Aaosphaeria arxii CBS 175.79]KAF2009187.1 hypothetical protein BU24DRAFT_84344 [Aaosphaeria arxii CBS 175.79]